MSYDGNVIVIDCEASGAIKNKGHPFDPDNKLCVVGIKRNNDPVDVFDVEMFPDKPYGKTLYAIQQIIDNADIIVGFNIKYDLHWLNNYGISFHDKKIWDCQLAHFIYESQSCPYPSLEDVCRHYGISGKTDTVKTEYWEKGLDTDQIPFNVLRDYCSNDIERTFEIFELQLEHPEFSVKQRLLSLSMMDLLVLQQMEFNGIKFDEQLASEKANTAERNIAELEHKLARAVFEITGQDASRINWSSNQQVSAVLFGGSVEFTERECVGEYKTGAKKGSPRYKINRTTVTFRKLFEPKRETKAEGVFQVDDKTLQLIANSTSDRRKQNIISLILEHRKQNKLVNTYFKGIPELIKQYNWQNSIIHGKIDQTMARTGRTNSSKPNLQNIPSSVRECFVTRYGR